MLNRAILGIAFISGIGVAHAQIQVTDAKSSKANPTTSACRLLSTKDLKAIGYEIKTPPRDNEMDMTTEMSGAPTPIHTDLCFYYADVENSRKSVSLAVERYEKMDGMLDWLKMKNEQAKTPTTVVTEFGSTVCEEGDYPVTVSKTAPRSPETTQFYVACDRVIANHRFSLSVENPVTRTGLPSVAETKELLDLVIDRNGKLR